MANLRVNNITSKDGKSGAVFDGIVTVNSTSHFIMPSGSTDYRNNGSGRAVAFGGYNPSKITTIDIFNISTKGNSTYFGEQTAAEVQAAAFSSSTRAFLGGGTPGTISLITFATEGNTQDFGGVTTALRRGSGGTSSLTRGMWIGGQLTSPALPSYIIDYINTSSTGDATDFGDLTVPRRQLAGCSNTTRAVFGGGYDSVGRMNVIDYVSTASHGNAKDFGDMLGIVAAFGSGSNTTRGLFAGGNTTNATTNQNVIQFVTIASTGNAQDFGDLTESGYHNHGACCSLTRAVFSGGYNGTPAICTNTIDYVEIATLGNAVDFGDITVRRAVGNDGSTSDCHGGLGD